MFDRACELKFDSMLRARHHRSLSGGPDLYLDKHRAESEHGSLGPENLCETFEASNKSTLGLESFEEQANVLKCEDAQETTNLSQPSTSFGGDATRETYTAPAEK